MGGIPRKFGSVAFAANTAARLKADASDSKSDVGDNMWVQVPPPAPMELSFLRSSFCFKLKLLFFHSKSIITRGGHYHTSKKSYLHIHLNVI